MIVRSARHGDMDRLVELGKQMHAEGAYASLPFDEAKVREQIADYLEHPEGRCLLVAEGADGVAGMLAGFVDEYYFCHETVACDLVLYVERAHRGSSAAVRLIRAFRAWAREQGARDLCLAVSSGEDIERTGRLYERLGLQCVGGVYRQRLR